MPEAAYDPDDCRTWPDEKVQELLESPEPWLRRWAEKEMRRRRNWKKFFDPHAVRRFDAREGAETTPGISERLESARLALRGHGLSDPTIAAMLEWIERWAGWTLPGSFRQHPDAAKVADILQTIINPETLFSLLKTAETAGRLRQGTTEALGRAYAEFGDTRYFRALCALHEGLVLEVFHPALRRPRRGRPSAKWWALLADLLANEVRRENPDWVWPAVADALRPFADDAGGLAGKDAERIRQIVDRWKRKTDRHAAPGHRWGELAAELKACLIGRPKKPPPPYVPTPR